VLAYGKTRAEALVAVELDVPSGVSDSAKARRVLAALLRTRLDHQGALAAPIEFFNVPDFQTSSSPFTITTKSVRACWQGSPNTRVFTLKISEKDEG
jgi:hypothetical protein